jgi:hypothetical protein
MLIAWSAAKRAPGAVGSSGLVAAAAGTERTVSAAQAAPASIRIFTIKTFDDQCLVGTNAAVAAEFKSVWQSSWTCPGIHAEPTMPLREQAALVALGAARQAPMMTGVPKSVIE